MIYAAPLNFSLYTFKWYGIITQSAALFTCTHVHYTHNYTPAVAVVVPSGPPWHVHFPQLSTAGERPVAAEGSLPL